MSFHISWAVVSIVLNALLSSGVQPMGNHSTTLELSNYLMANYSKAVRPVRDWRRTTTVAIDLMVYAILNVDEKNQVLTTYIWYRQFWTDEFLQWDPQDFDNIIQLSIPTENIWVPDILINEFVDVGKSPDIPYVYVNHEGQVKNYKPIQVVTACSLEIYSFPFDVQNCTFTFTSWLHNIRDINISLLRSPEAVKYDRSIFMNKGEWELLYINTQFNEFNLEREVTNDGYAEMRFYLVIRRRPLFYAVNLLLPSILLMLMDIIGFNLPPDCAERVSFKITLLLGYSVFLIIVSDTLPATAIGTPLIGVYFVVCMALLVISLTETIFIVRLIHKQDLQPQVPEWLKHLVLEKVTVWFCIPNKKPPSPALPYDRKHNPAVAQIGCRNEAPCNVSDEPGPPVSDSLQGVDCILHEVSAIRHFLEKRERFRDIAKEWLEVGYVLDVLLYRVYLLVVTVYIIILSILWSVWQHS
ncbi:5-hydroxytryptamine receptor 3A-like [Leucoraja erinacea]|uniref:5-hydroxytryptamine receptor 3A-like n=1 Tax=Leucoraja erinaceus TaxID=7782 RepID=UPI002455E4F5|nr:5-hydroxytryptamine receptor 3A-like [Leucoraja erinacea]